MRDYIMTKYFTPHASSPRFQRIGRKALQADRLSRALALSNKKSTKRSLRLPTLRKNTILAIGIALVIVLGVSAGGVRYYTAQAEANKKAALLQQQKDVKEKSSIADACRRKKAEQKADLIGKVTYDELYDYGECDK